jgi:glycosyltransferase involved in cell wall biosynthesis
MERRSTAVSAPPTIAVVIPLYNKAAFVQQAVDAVLAQTSRVDELIVIDDGSVDAGPSIVQAFADDRIQLVRQPNSGVSAARNRGIRIASSEFVAFLDADDYYKPKFIEAIRELIAQWPEAAVYCSGYSRAKDGAESVDCLHRAMRPKQTGLIDDFYSDWCQQTFTNSSAIVVRRTALLQCDPMFVEGERLGEDQDLWFRLAERYPVVYVNRPLSVYRIAVAQSAMQGANESLDLLPCYQRLAERLTSDEVPHRLRRGARRLLASHLLNLARRSVNAHKPNRALSYLLDRRSYGHLSYWIRTASVLVWSRLSGKQAG